MIDAEIAVDLRSQREWLQPCRLAGNEAQAAQFTAVEASRCHWFYGVEHSRAPHHAPGVPVLQLQAGNSKTSAIGSTDREASAPRGR